MVSNKEKQMKVKTFEELIVWQKAYFGSGTNSILVRGLIAFW